MVNMLVCISDAGTETQDILIGLSSVLQTLPVSRNLHLKRSGRNLLNDLSKLMTAVNADGFGVERITRLLKAVLSKEPDDVIWMIPRHPLCPMPSTSSPSLPPFSASFETNMIKFLAAIPPLFLLF